MQPMSETIQRMPTADVQAISSTDGFRPMSNDVKL